MICIVELTIYFVCLPCAVSLAEIFYPPDYGANLCGSDDSISFDFIVCGAGSAGSTIASRLSEDSSFNVLLLERGKDPEAFTEIPFSWASSLKSDIDYQYVSEPDDIMFKGLEGEVSSIPRGKVSGGCSTINACIYIRGNRRDFDNWAENGCTGWDYKSVLKYFLKSEDYQSCIECVDSSYHSTGGPLTVTRFAAPDPAIEIFSEGYRQLGLAELSDLNGRWTLGFADSDSTTRKGRRCSTFKAFLPLATSRPNFYFARNVLVRRVLFDEWKTAIGVEITAPNGKDCLIKAKREVILSLGAIGTPQALMLSGIGPAESLRQVNIEPLVDLPVGLNYQDHLCFVGTVFSDRKNRTPEEVEFESLKLVNDTLKLVNENISTMGLSQLVAFTDTTNSSPYPDIQLMLVRLSYRSMMQTFNGKHKLYNLFGFSQETADFFTQLSDKTDLIFVIVILLDFESTGYIELRSSNPVDYPKIYPQFLRHQKDVDTMLRAIKLVQNLAETDALKNYGLELEHINYKGCSHTEPFSDAYWTCALQQIATGFYHPGGSVKMGAANDESAVLTPRLYVKGVHGLRVVDASAMHRMVSANPNAAVIMMAEKLADMIKEDHHKSVFNVFRCLLATFLRQKNTNDRLLTEEELYKLC